MPNRIHLNLARMSGREFEFIQEAFADNWIAPAGPNIDAFEEELKRFIIQKSEAGSQKPEVVALSSGTAAIHLALVLLGVKANDEVVCQSFTFCASANPISYLGAKPVFVDSEDYTWNMSPELLEEAIQDRIAVTGRKPKAIILVHLYGLPAKIDEILEISQRYEIPVIEDAADALGSEYKGLKCGTFGEFGVFSFNGNKMITTSGGGALVCRDTATAEKAIYYATQAREHLPYYHHEHIGFNYRMSNICAGIGRGQMTVLDEFIAHHRHVHELYKEAFADVAGITLKDNPDERFNANFWLNTIIINPLETGVDYEQLRLFLDAAGIESRPLWKPMHLQPVYKDAPRYENGVSEDLFKRGLCLPSGPCVTDEEVKYIVENIKAAIAV